MWHRREVLRVFSWSFGVGFHFVVVVTLSRGFAVVSSFVQTGRVCVRFVASNGLGHTGEAGVWFLPASVVVCVLVGFGQCHHSSEFFVFVEVEMHRIVPLMSLFALVDDRDIVLML